VDSGVIARVWHGVVPSEKADDYAQYLAGFGLQDYQRVPGNCRVQVLRRNEGAHVHFLLLSLWSSHEAIVAYAGPDIERAHYYPYDLECLIDPEPRVAHYDVVASAWVNGS
jgi:heme-degrading monooxygenase HmoA